MNNMEQKLYVSYIVERGFFQPATEFKSIVVNTETDNKIPSEIFIKKLESNLQDEEEKNSPFLSVKIIAFSPIMVEGE